MSFSNLNSFSLGVFRQASKELENSLERLSSSQRINKAQDDPAGSALNNRLKSDAAILQRGRDNLTSGVALAEKADEALDALSDVVDQASALAELATSVNLSREQRDSLNEEAQKLSREFSRIVQTTDYNGRPIFSASYGAASFQTNNSQAGILSSTLGGIVSDGTFQASRTIATAGDAYVIDTADFNGDGNMDFAFTNQLDDAIQVHLGDGAGGFDSGLVLAAGDRPRSIEAADLNNDGIMDIIAANDGGTVPTNASVTVFFGNGDGTFQAGGSYDTGLGTIGVATGDFNGDGLTDFVTADYDDGTISLYEGVGGGEFGARTVVASGITAVYDIAVADFDNNGTDDFAAVQANGATSKLYAYSGAGDGSFTLSASYALGQGSFYVDKGDLNNDGTVDLVTAVFATNQLAVLTGTGTGTFQLSTNSTGSGSLDGVKIADLNGDGNQDVVTTNFATSSLSIFYGSGNGTLSSAVTIATGSAPNDIALADFNNDTVLDIASANSASDNILLRLSNTTAGIGSLAPINLNSMAGAYQAIDVLERKSVTLDSQKGAISGFYKRVEAAAATNDQIATIHLVASDQILQVDEESELRKINRTRIVLDRSASGLVQHDLNEAVILSVFGDNKK